MSELLDAVHQRHLRVDGGRLLSRIDELRTIGGLPDGGVSRLAFTPEDAKAREMVAGYMTEAGLDVRMDAACNVIGTRDGELPGGATLLMGSHIDTVPNGGALDGAYGVLAAIEVLHTLQDHRIRLNRPAAVVAFTNEEGAGGSKGMWGSHAIAGALEPADLVGTDDEGTTMAELLAGIGGDVRRMAETAWPPGRIGAYLELHIEQGPVLEHEGFEIGVVEAITGRMTVNLCIRGEGNHSGTTPMELRKDALVAASRIVLAVQTLAGAAGLVRVATVGCCTVEPNAWNVVPASANLRVDLRDVSSAAIDKGLHRLRAIAADVAEMTDTAIDVAIDQVVAPVACDLDLRELIAGAADRLHLSRLDLPSGAGHDAQVIGRIAPIAMIFVPSQRGQSHTPTESTEPTQLVAGADVLLHTVLDYDRK
jgi:hydantoinase/carbamoylase family amidase